jgi:RHS repeat-associated protein
MTNGPLPSGAFGAYVYDSRNRLTSAGGSGYRYNPAGSGAATWVVDPNAALSRVLMRTKAGTTTYYVYGLGLLYEDTNGATKTYHFNQVGSTLAITDAGQNVTDRVGYSPFGTVVERSNPAGAPTDTPFLFNGEFGVMTDANGLLHMRARYYNPRIMRFCNADPIGFGGGMNWYAFVSNSPIGLTDPSGLVAWKDLGSASLGLVSNGLGVVTGFALALIPEPTMVTKAAAVVVVGKSSYGFGASVSNFAAALADKPALSKGSLANDVAQLVAPGNKTAQQAASAVDLAADFATGRISANAAKSLAGKMVRGANGFPLYEMQYQVVKDPASLGKLADAFVASSVAQTAYDNLVPDQQQQAAGGCRR